MLTDRYARREIENIWNEEGYFKAMFEVVKAVVKTQGELNIIPNPDAKKILHQAKYTIEDIKNREKTTKHETYAFLDSIASNLDEDCRQYLHYGLTSSDLLDTALSLKLFRSADIILREIEGLQVTLKNLANKYKDTVCVGRTHGIHAEPYSMGLKFALYYAEFDRHRQRLAREKENVTIAKISGALGNYAHFSPKLEQKVAKNLNLRTTGSNTQVIARDHLYYFMTVLVGLAATVEKVAVEIRHMQRTEVGEWQEAFSDTQKGSSAMPHKKNPVGSENLTGLARVCRSGLSAIIENIALWHERDISHSSVERLVVPQTIILCDFMIHRLNEILSHLGFNERNIEKNLRLTGDMIFSQKLMLELVKCGESREEAYSNIRSFTEKADKDGSNLFDALLKDPFISKHMNKNKLKQIFQNKTYLCEVDAMYRNIFQSHKTKQDK